MVSEIIWSSLSRRTYEENIQYLQMDWSEKEIINFKKATERKLMLLKEFPEISFSSKKNRYLRKTLIGRRVILIYGYKQRNNKIELVQFLSSRQNK